MSARPTHEVSTSESQCTDGTQPRVLDVIEIELTSHQPDGHQHENHGFDPRTTWVRKGTLTHAHAVPLVDRRPILWVNDSHSKKGVNDEVTPADAARFRHSLVLVQPDALEISVQSGGYYNETRAEFDLGGVVYNLKVTDPAVNLAIGIHEMPTGTLVCVSLGELFEKSNGDVRAFKLAAAIIRP